MASLVEPKQLRLPQDTLVLQPMHGHLDLAPMLLLAGVRCTIGTADHCTARLGHAALVEEEHCVIEVIGRKTMLTHWAHEATWLNDRLVTEPRELIAGDRVAIGPFDFRLRFASNAELVSAKLIEPEVINSSETGLSIGNSSGVSLGNELKNDLISELSDSNPRRTTISQSEQMAQHVSSLLGDLQNQVQLLQEKDAELSGQIRQRREEASGAAVVVQSPVVRLADITRDQVRPVGRPVSPLRDAQWKKQAEDAASQLKADREALDRERAELVSERARYNDLLKQVEQQQLALTSALESLESKRQQQQAEDDQLRQRAQQLTDKEEQLSTWENRLREAESAIDRRKTIRSWQVPVPASSQQPKEFSRAIEIVSSSSGPQSAVEQPAIADRREPSVSTVSERMSRSAPLVRSIEPGLNPQTDRPLQTFLTLIAFTSAAILLGIGVGDPDVSVSVGWSMAIMGAISTVDLLCRRWFGVS